MNTLQLINTLDKTLKREEEVKRRTVRFLDAEEVLAGSGGEIATGESVFGGFVEEVFDVLGAYVSSPCFFTLP